MLLPYVAFLCQRLPILDKVRRNVSVLVGENPDVTKEWQPDKGTALSPYPRFQNIQQSTPPLLLPERITKSPELYGTVTRTRNGRHLKLIELNQVQFINSRRPAQICSRRQEDT